MELSDSQVCDDLLGLIKRVKACLATVAEAHHITLMQLNALYAISHGHMIMGQLADNLHCDASNITGIIDRLVAQGLVTRKESSQDRRAKILALTKEGQKIMDDALATLPVKLGCNRLGEDERATMHVLINKVINP